MAWKLLPKHFRLALMALTVVIGAAFAQPLFVAAGPVTNLGSAPFVKLGVYQGLLTIAPTPVCVGGSNPGTSCTSNLQCLAGGICTASSVMEIGNAGRDIAGTGELYLRPGGLSRTAAARIFLNNSRADLFLSGGNLCLGSISASTCNATWPVTNGTGDTYWEEVSNAGITSLQPHATNAGSVTIRIGRASAGIPAASGRTLEVFGNGIAAVRISSDFTSGYFDWGTGIWSGGNVYINGGFNVRNDNLQSDYYTGAHGVYTALDRYNQFLNIEGSIDADMFDSASVLPFRSKYCVNGTNPGASCPNGNECTGGGVCRQNDLFLSIKPIPNSPNDRHRLCLRTNESKLCIGGAVNSNAGAPCVAAGDCTNGAVCTEMCGTENRICPIDPAINPDNPIAGGLCLYGPNEGQSCTNSTQCTGGICTFHRCAVGSPYHPGTQPCEQGSQCGSGVCIRGEHHSQGGFASSFCSGMTCQEVCEFKYVNRCNGQTNAGICNAYGEIPRYVTGDVLRTNSAFGSCFPDNNLPTWWLNCDCYVETPFEYEQALSPGNGGLLCTQLLL